MKSDSKMFAWGNIYHGEYEKELSDLRISHFWTDWSSLHLLAGDIRAFEYDNMIGVNLAAISKFPSTNSLL